MKATRRVGVNDATVQRLNVRLTLDQYRRLNVHALMTGVDLGALVGRLIDDHLREFRVQANPPARVKGSDRLDLDGSVSLVDLSGTTTVQA